MARVVAGSAAGLQATSNATMQIINGGRVIGSIALNEKRIIDLATLAKNARAATIPGIIAIGATELIKYGLEKCADGTWCKAVGTVPAGSVDPSSGGWWSASGGLTCRSSTETCSAEAACESYRSLNQPAKHLTKIVLWTPRQAQCWLQNNGQTGDGAAWSTLSRLSDYVAPTQPVPATDADVETAWKQAFQTNPFIQEKYWGFEDQTKQNQMWADALAQTAAIIGNNVVTQTLPSETTQTAAGTTTTTTTKTYTASPNADAATQKENPLKVGEKVTTTTVNPDGTTTTTTTEKTSTPVGGDKAAPVKVDVETCGLPGKPACKIDETGTPTGQKTETATETTQAMDSAAKTQTDGVNTVLNGEKPETNWFGWLPQIPRSECKPISVSPLEVTVEVDWCPAVGYMQVLSTAIWSFTLLGFSVAEVRDALNGG